MKFKYGKYGGKIKGNVKARNIDEAMKKIMKKKTMKGGK